MEVSVYLGKNRQGGGAFPSGHSKQSASRHLRKSPHKRGAGFSVCTVRYDRVGKRFSARRSGGDGRGGGQGTLASVLLYLRYPRPAE